MSALKSARAWLKRQFRPESLNANNKRKTSKTMADYTLWDYHTLQSAHDRGEMKRPTQCEDCWEEYKDARGRGLHGHHYAGYDGDNWWNLVYLCPACHSRWHRIEKIIQRKQAYFEQNKENIIPERIKRLTR